MNRNKEYRLKRKSLRKDYIIQDKNVKISRLYYLNENKKSKIEELEQENKQLKEKVDYLKEQKENTYQWCQLIADIGFDYDGYNDVENLKQIIDELVQYAICCRDGYSYEDFIKEGVKDE